MKDELKTIIEAHTAKEPRPSAMAPYSNVSVLETRGDESKKYVSNFACPSIFAKCGSKH